MVVVGAGFAGINAVKHLAKAPVRITVLDRRNHHLFQPLLYQVATAALDPSDIAYPIRSVFRRQRNVERVLLSRVLAVRPEQKRLELEGGDTLAYDHLVLATGATHSYFGHEEWEAFAPGLKTVEDALEIRRRVLMAYERAERDPEHQQELLTFVVVGAGPTGVELAGALVEIAVHSLAQDFQAIDPTRARVLLVEGGERVLGVYPEDLSASALRQLETLGVEVLTGRQVVAIDSEGVSLSDGERIAARTVLWAAGVRASSLGASLGVELDRAGRVKVEEDLSVPGYPEVFVVGDLASVVGKEGPVPGVAPAAIQAGRHAAEQIKADLAGRERRPFRYRDKGSLATIGKARAIAHIGRWKFSGLTAWLAWMGIHVAFLIGFRNRLFVLLSWAWSYVTFGRGARLITQAGERPRAS